MWVLPEATRRLASYEVAVLPQTLYLRDSANLFGVWGKKVATGEEGENVCNKTNK